MEINNGELLHSRERGNVPWFTRLAKKFNQFDGDAPTPVKALEDDLTFYYRTQLNLSLLNQITVEGQKPDKWGVDWSTLEMFLRQGFLMVVALDGTDTWRIIQQNDLAGGIGLGFNGVLGLGAQGVDGSGMLYDEKTKKKLYPIMPEDPTKGDYVIFSNKNVRAFLNLNNTQPFSPTINIAGMTDEELVNTTAVRLAKARATAYQNMEQMRSSMVYTSKNKSKTALQVARQFLGGYQVIGVDDSLDVQASFSSINGGGVLASYMDALRMEYDFIIGEFSMWTGLSSSGSIKQSGVSDLEAASKMQQTQSMAEIYLQARQTPLDLINARCGIKQQDGMTAMYNQQAAQLIDAIVQEQFYQTQAAKVQAEATMAGDVTGEATTK